MSDFDFNIDNYQLSDLLNLFKITHNLTKDELRKAKQMVLSSHPDKSKLPSEYFIFFKRAYERLHQIYIFKNKSEKTSYNTNTTYSADDDEDEKEERKILLEKIKGKDFNKWFNKMFEKNKADTDDHGYGDWLKSDEDCDTTVATNKEQMNRAIESRKKHIRDLVVHRDVEDYSSGGGYNIIDSGADNFGSSLFSKLGYDDLKHAHSESVIPVTEEDYTKREKFNSENDIKEYRNQQDLTPLSNKQALDYLANKESLQNFNSADRAYKLAQQSEEFAKKNKEWWSQLKQLTD